MATYFIGTSGSDTNSGVRDTPFASVAAALSVIQPGDTVYFLAGTCRNATYGDGDIWKASNDSVIRLSDVNGAPDAWITIAAEPGGDVRLEYDGAGAIVLRGSSYIRFRGSRSKAPMAQSRCRKPSTLDISNASIQEPTPFRSMRSITAIRPKCWIVR